MSLAQRLRQLDSYDLTASLRLREGDLHDYAKLAVYHYRAARPATASRVWVLEDARRTAAVLVESLPGLSSTMRDYALGDRYSSIADWRQRSLLLNREITCLSRVVVHPQWRGTGLAVRLVRQALATARTPYVEALAAMGQVNPFFERAGMTAYRRPVHDYDQRLLAALRRAGFEATDLTHTNWLAEQIDAMQPRAMRDWLWRELRRWYGHNSGKRVRGGSCLQKVDRSDPDSELLKMLRSARDRAGLTPVYYLKRIANPAQES